MFWCVICRLFVTKASYLSHICLWPFFMYPITSLYLFYLNIQMFLKFTRVILHGINRLFWLLPSSCLEYSNISYFFKSLHMFVCAFFQQFLYMLRISFYTSDQLNKEPNYFLDTGSFTSHFYYLYLEIIMKFSVNIR